jgi:hypothetical protein
LFWKKQYVLVHQKSAAGPMGLYIYNGVSPSSFLLDTNFWGNPDMLYIVKRRIDELSTQDRPEAEYEENAAKKKLRRRKEKLDKQVKLSARS